MPRRSAGGGKTKKVARKAGAVRKVTHLRRVAVWGGLALLAAVVGGLAGYLVRDLPRQPAAPETPRADLAGVEALAGPLDPQGTRLRVRDRRGAEELVGRLRAVAERGGLTLAHVRWSAGNARTELRSGGATYPLVLDWRLEIPPALPRLAIVIDDVGRDLARARAFLDLDVPVTLSILPYLPASREAALLARERGQEYLLHLPMEPQGYPDTDPGEGALLVGMGEAEVRQTVVRDLEEVPGVAGVNNHMGSRLTELPEPLGWVMGELGKRGLYFLDSLTTPRSAAAAAAREAGLPWARRDVFLDNVREIGAVRAQLDKAVRRAREAGRAVAIGHPHPATLEALRVWSARISDRDVVVVPLGDLVTPGDGA